MSSPSWAFRVEDGGSTPGYAVTLYPAERELVLALVLEVAALLGATPPLDAAPPLDADDVAGTDDDDAHPFDASGWSSDPVGAPEDPALRRLFPDAYRDDPGHAAEFRRLTEGDLRAAKSARLRRLATVLSHEDGPSGGDADSTDPGDRTEVRVPAPFAPEVVAALTDLRLVMAERLGVRTADDADDLVGLVTRPWEQDVSDPVRAAARLRATLYLMLGALQDTLLDAMTGGDASPRLGSPRE